MPHPAPAELGKRTSKGKVIRRQVSDLQPGHNHSSPVCATHGAELCSSSLVHDEPADTQCRTQANMPRCHADLSAEPAWDFPEPILSYRVFFSAFLGITKALAALLRELCFAAHQIVLPDVGEHGFPPNPCLASSP